MSGEVIEKEKACGVSADTDGFAQRIELKCREVIRDFEQIFSLLPVAIRKNLLNEVECRYIVSTKEDWLDNTEAPAMACEQYLHRFRMSLSAIGIRPYRDRLLGISYIGNFRLERAQCSFLLLHGAKSFLEKEAGKEYNSANCAAITTQVIMLFDRWYREFLQLAEDCFIGEEAKAFFKTVLKEINSLNRKISTLAEERDRQ